MTKKNRENLAPLFYMYMLQNKLLPTTFYSSSSRKIVHRNKAVASCC